MTIIVETQLPPEFDHVVDWLERTAQQQGVRQAQELAVQLARRYPDQPLLMELVDWLDPLWWAPIEFGAVRMERRSAQHFEFIWSLALDTDFSKRLKQVPRDLTPKDLLHALSRDYAALIPRRRSIQWVLFHGSEPIGVSMFMGINFENRSAEQIMGVLPEFDRSFLVGDAYCASLLFAYNALGLNRVYGNIYAYNEQTATLQQRLGFRREGCAKQAVWDEDLDAYVDLMQIALLREEFERSRVLQRFISRQQRPEWLMRRRDWPRRPLA